MMFFAGMIAIILPFGVVLGGNACLVSGCGIHGNENVQKLERGSHGVIAGKGNPLKECRLDLLRVLL